MDGMGRMVVFACCAGTCMMEWGALAHTADCGVVNVAEHVKGDGASDVSEAIQRLIDGHPNRTLYFPDGVYLLAKPIATPADPKRSVDLRLANFATLRADPGWAHEEAMVRLGGVHPMNDIGTPGSNYSFTGGIVDGAGVAKGISIDSGRETRIENVSIKNVRIGIWIKHGANSGSSDSDVLNVNVVGNGATDSIGVLVEGYDNTLSHMRIANVYVGVKLVGGGTFLRNVHPLFTGRWEDFERSVGFLDFGSDNTYEGCYSDQFSTGYAFMRGNRSVLNNCIAWWYAKDPGRPHVAFRSEGRFEALVVNPLVGFSGTEAVNTVLDVKTPGGGGFLSDVRMDERRVRASDTAFRSYLRGKVH